MPIFKKVKDKLIKIKEKTTPAEKDIQKITEENLEEIFELEIISSEFSLNKLRVDTLCFNPELKSFVIIEYKKDRSFSVIDQGFAYLALMLNNKADFLLEYNEKNKNKQLSREDVNWSQSKIIFISPFFTPHQKAAINFKNLPLELWEINYYEEGLIEYAKIDPIETSEDIETVTREDITMKEVAKKIKLYDLDYHLKKSSEVTRKLFYKMREKIFELGEIKEKYLQFYVGYRNSESSMNFCTIHIHKGKLRIGILIPDKKLEDPKKWGRKFPTSYGFAKNLKTFDISSEKYINYAMNLIEQSYEFNKNR